MTAPFTGETNGGKVKILLMATLSAVALSCKSPSHQERQRSGGNSPDPSATSDKDKDKDGNRTASNSPGDDKKSSDDEFDPTRQEHCLPLSPDNPRPKDAIIASMRRDYFLENYAEPDPLPRSGMRWHIATSAKAGGAVQQVKINQRTLEELMSQGEIDWYHVWPRTLTKDQPVFVMLHTRKTFVAPCKNHRLEISTDAGSAVDGNFMGNESPVRLSSVMVRENMQEMVVHLQNLSSLNVQKIAHVRINGQDLSNSPIITSKTMRPRETKVWVFPLPQKTALGQPWTVAVDFANIDDEVGVGRVVPAFFPIEGWVSSAECPYPNGNAQNFQEHVKRGFDTFFLGTFKATSACPNKDHDDMFAGFPGSQQWLLLNQFIDQKPPHSQNIAGRLIGDEADNTSEDKLAQQMRDKVKLSWDHWKSSEDVPTYIGASRNRRVGMFAGIADIQGMDFYAAACAPHVTQWGKGFSLQAPLDYLNAARRNHMPNPTWLYAQGLSHRWNGKIPLLNQVIHRQPRAHEIWVQAMSTIAAGAKGVMWFQTELAEARANREQAEAWEAIGKFNANIRAVRHLLLESAPTGTAIALADNVYAEALVSPTAIVVPLINFRTGGSPTDLGCGVQQDMHWQILDNETKLNIPIPKNLKIGAISEVRDGKLVPFTDHVTISPSEVVIANVPLSQADPARLFVLTEKAP